MTVRVEELSTYEFGTTQTSLMAGSRKKRSASRRLGSSFQKQQATSAKIPRRRISAACSERRRAGIGIHGRAVADNEKRAGGAGEHENVEAGDVKRPTSNAQRPTPKFDGKSIIGVAPLPACSLGSFPMRFRTYKNTDLEVSEVGFGLWTISTGWWGQFTEGEAVGLMHKAFDLGVTLFDAADTYGNGLSEELIAKAFPTRRDDIVVATKIGYDFSHFGNERRGQREIPHDFSPELVRATDAALQRLKTDRIDLLQLHNIRMEQVYDDAIWETLEKLQGGGKILHTGIALGRRSAGSTKALIVPANAILLPCNTFTIFSSNIPARQCTMRPPKRERTRCSSFA